MTEYKFTNIFRNKEKNVIIEAEDLREATVEYTIMKDLKIIKGKLIKVKYND